MRAVTLAPHDTVLGRRAALRARFSPVVGAELPVRAAGPVHVLATAR